jgi:formate hydrogenlyase transcriptional activator
MFQTRSGHVTNFTCGFRILPRVKVKCATLPTNLIESELFGHENDAFSSAHARQFGLFEVANGAMLFVG